jgi:uncharacterized protein
MESYSNSHPHGAMRRKDREITDRLEIETIVKTGRVMHIALADRTMPYVVPVFYAFDGKAIYFHSAKAGSKVEIIKRNNNICFEISLDQGIIESDSACDFEARHRTVIGIGKAVFVNDDTEKIKALNLIVGQFTPEKFEYPAANLNATLVVRIDIDSMKGKKHGF